MIDALISGTLIRDPLRKMTKNGDTFASFLLSAQVDGEQPIVISGIAFGDAAERITKLKKGDAVSVAGSLKTSKWTDKETGEVRHGLNIQANACLTLYDIRKRKDSKATS